MMKRFAFIAITSCLLATTAYAKEKYPMLLDWDNQLSQTARAELLSKPTIKREIQEAYKGWVESECYGTQDYKKCLENPPTPPVEGVFDVISVATPDLNNDGKRDLILYMSSETGLSGNGNCGIMEVWFYENVGNDYRNIGKEEFLHSNNFYLGKPMAKGKFRDIITRDVNGFCSGEKITKFVFNKYDYKKSAYFRLERETY